MARAAAPVSGAPAMSWHPPASPASSSSPMGQWGRRLCPRSPCCGYMKTYGLAHQQLAMVSVAQRETAVRNPHATFKAPITVEGVLNSRMIAYPFQLLQCCLLTDGGGAPILAIIDMLLCSMRPSRSIFAIRPAAPCAHVGAGSDRPLA